VEESITLLPSFHLSALSQVVVEGALARLSSSAYPELGLHALIRLTDTQRQTQGQALVCLNPQEEGQWIDLFLPLINGGVLVGSIDLSVCFRREKNKEGLVGGGEPTMELTEVQVSDVGSEDTSGK